MTRWLDDDEQRAWRAYLQMQNRLTARLGRQLQQDSGLSLADYEVLVALTDAAEGRLRPFALQRQLEWEQSRLSHHLSRMQRRGLVDREGCPGDRRGAFVVLTPAGREAIEAAAPGHVAAVREFFLDQVGQDEVATLERLATRVLRRLDADEQG
ncbi:MarR family transcriptional regulator [Micromonospora echinospora]|uniref:DNA-binding transcriptional regulator, MarR family n=1 Tax=Micromonospora echinospora TaxID=1877 RepID=A0A1C4ZUE0_MICEC|nr:MarR family winged helix-turn-helix transcriptional regulator [Micromonospora echinospora]OZV83973.1 MarR family transcriptional regulator [Micromonospora echinospora]SCF36580.1 DNA-binding transcriptional regulator, MarR family [Micromonospora echinospora]